MVVKSNFKKRSYGLDTILLQGHAVTLTFKVATPNVAYNTLFQYGGHFYEIFLKSDFK